MCNEKECNDGSKLCLQEYMPPMPKKLFLEFIEAAFLEGRMRDTQLVDYLVEKKRQYKI